MGKVGLPILEYLEMGVPYPSFIRQVRHNRQNLRGRELLSAARGEESCATRIAE